MKHYKLAEWSDFARGLVAGEERLAMTGHLQGCSECRLEVQMWQEVAAAAIREASYTPPEAAVRIAKSYAAQGTAEPKQSWLTQVAELIFDSNLTPVTAGIRNTAAAARQMLYASGEYSIDLRIEPEPGTSRRWIVGQILSRTGQSVRNVPITLVSELGPIATATTNPYGEFHLDLEAASRVELSARLGNTHVLIPLGDLAPGPSAGGPSGLRGGH